MGAGKVSIAIPDLARYVAAIFAARGMSAADAKTVADVLVWADARGVASHGISRAPRYLGFIDKGQLDPVARPTVDSAAGASFAIDAHRAAGPVALRLALATGAQQARAHGASFGVVRNTTHTGAIGYYIHEAVGQGFAALMFAAGVPLMAYQGARAAGVGTNPIAIGVPGDDGPIVLDMATSLVSNGRLMQAKQAGRPIPEDWALTAEGLPTTDAALAEIPLPLGGAKGSGLALMFEMLSGVLGGSSLLLDQLAPGAKRRHGASASLLLVDIARFRPLAAFMADATALGRLVKGLPRAGDEPILLPGERSAKAGAASAQTGIALSRKSWDGLVEAGHRLGVAPPPIGY